MRERPILFSAPLVKALLDGRKTVTRRIVKPQPPEDMPVSRIRVEHFTPAIERRNGLLDGGPVVFGAYDDFGEWGARCAYEPGMRLWVQESYRLDHVDGLKHAIQWAHETKRPLAVDCHYLADGAQREVTLWLDDVAKLHARSSHPTKPQPGRFMYRSCSRLSLAVESVRVERLQDISEEDARAEGVDHCDVHGHDDCFHGTVGHRCAFEQLWDSINGDRAPWNVNPWVWVIGLRRVTEEGRRG